MEALPRWPTERDVAAVASPPRSPVRSSLRPLCVSLDGALVSTDSLWEAVLLAVKRRPWLLLLAPFWFLRGKAFLQQRLAPRDIPEASTLPYREQTLQFLRRQKAAGRTLILVGGRGDIARAVAGHLELFDQIVASRPAGRGTGRARLAAIQQCLGRRSFAYLGHSSEDLDVWQAAAEAYLIAPNRRLVERARSICAPLVLDAADDGPGPLQSCVKALRPHQWVKNLLVFVPLFFAHQTDQLAKAGAAVLAFAAFCCCASAIYVLNDLLDIEADRRHETKRRRPFAAGRLSPTAGLVLSPLLGLLGLGAACQFVSLRFGALLALYVLLTTAYSLFLKKQAVLDVLLLAGLYTFRILAGAVAVDVLLSPWLSAFSLFFFFSLALGKRYVELSRRDEADREDLPGRGYRREDLPLLESLGPTSGYMAVLVFCLYIESAAVKAMYGRPWVLWLACPLLLYWLTRFWLLARRRQIADDPVVFALKDPASLCSIAATAASVLLAKA